MRERTTEFWERALSEIDDHGYFAELDQRKHRAVGTGGRVARPAAEWEWLLGGREPPGGGANVARSAADWPVDGVVAPGSLRLSDLWLIALALSPLWLFGFAAIVLLNSGIH